MSKPLKYHLFDPSKKNGTACGAKTRDGWTYLVDPTEWWKVTCDRCQNDPEIRDRQSTAAHQIDLLYDKLWDPDVPLTLNKIFAINNLCIVYGLDKAFAETQEMIEEHNKWEKLVDSISAVKTEIPIDASAFVSSCPNCKTKEDCATYWNTGARC